MFTNGRVLISIIAGVLLLVFGLLIRVWSGFLFFLLVTGILILLYWTICLILDYYEEYNKQSMEEKFAFYCSVQVNQSNLTMDAVQKSRKIYFKKFKRSLLKEKCFFWLKILFTLGFVVALVYLMF